jgi:hypothetical protein
MLRFSRVVLPGFVAITIATTLIGCGGGRQSASVGADETASATETTGTVPSAQSRLSISGSKPVDAYVLLGGKIKTCWFNPDDPLLPQYVYRADVAPDGSKVQITVNERRNLGRAGKVTYMIDFDQEGAYTVVNTLNLSMPPDLAAKMQFDIGRWKNGEQNCSKEMPRVTAAPPASQTKAQ